MTKSRTLHRCTSCGSTAPQWAGRCGVCGEWNTLVEETTTTSKGAGRPSTANAAVSLVGIVHESSLARATGLPELDRVLGGGITPGSVTLLGGEPGIGKSTLVLQLCSSLSEVGGRCLVVTGEESAQQVARRAERLGAAVDNVFLLAESDVSQILASVDELSPQLVVVDSIQTMNVSSADSAPGSVTQVRECAQAFVALAKRRNIAVLLVGHVTKEGALAGPRVLEHIVDTVLEFEGDRHHGLRFLRTTKHRFGATDEIGVMEMTERGLVGVPDASGLFLDDRKGGIGSIVVPTVQGRRPLLVEIQSLIVPTEFPPRRVGQGLDSGRLSVLLAVLNKRAGVVIGKDDAYVSVIGGAKVDEPAADLGIVLSIASSKWDVEIAEDVVAIGEVGLGGEVRKVGHASKRLSEAARMGFRRAVVPAGTTGAPSQLTLIPVSTVNDALEALGINRSRTGRAVRLAT